MDEIKQGGMVCKCHHHKIVPLAIILIGLSVLFTNLGYLSADTNAIVWPVLLIVIGVIKLGKCKCC